MSPELTIGALEKLDKYQIDLKGMREDVEKFVFHLDDSFFADVDATDVRKGKVEVSLSVRKTSHAFDLHFHTEGVVTVTCDRCLDDMEQPVASDDTLHVKFGPDYAEDADNWVTAPEEEGIINVAWFIYEFIVLAVPMKHVHAPGECNEAMSTRLNQYLCTTPDESDDEDDDEEDSLSDVAEEAGDRPIDPRWNELKKILDNN